jgi:hypothetical protein
MGHGRGNMRTDPDLFLSMRLGATERTYVQVQMRRRITSRSDWKLNRADCALAESERNLSGEIRTAFTMSDRCQCAVKEGGRRMRDAPPQRPLLCLFPSHR